jgi:hydroxyethylthiazole kinase-like uncharacterized protein yjeF
MPNSIYGMKVFSPEQIKRLDISTISEMGITMVELIEIATDKFVEAFLKCFPISTEVYVFCGLGKNGGDGLAISRKLGRLKYAVSTFILNSQHKKFSLEFDQELEKIDVNHFIKYLNEEADFPLLSEHIVIIDAIYGTGLNKSLDSITTSLVNSINSCGCKIVSVDIASGLFSNRSSKENLAVQPTFTFSFLTPKLAFFFPENELKTGEFKILDIGLSQKFIENEETNFFFVQRESIRLLLKQRNKFSHKGNFGHVLLFAGHQGMMGAALLASKAALRSGSGLVSLLCAEDQISIVQAAIWEVICIEYDADKSLYELQFQDFEKYTLGMGPGIGTESKIIQLFKMLLLKQTKPIVIDADGLNIIAKNKELLKLVPLDSILTPHPKEFEHLVGTWKNDFERLEKQIEFSKTNNLYVVLKGANSSISTPSGLVYFNSTGNSGMATAGSGDVLSGIIVSLLAQNYSSEQAAVIGVFIHGLAGDLASKKYGQNSMLASDIIEHLPFAFKELQEA